MFNLTYEYKLKPTTAQTAIFEDWLEQCRRVYNYALAERKHWFESRSCQVNACSIRSEFIIPAETKRPTYASQCKNLTAARANIPDLGVVQVHVLQQARLAAGESLRKYVGTKAWISTLQKSRSYAVFCIPTTRRQPSQKWNPKTTQNWFSQVSSIASYPGWRNAQAGKDSSQS